MKMLLLFLLQVTFLTTLTQAFDVELNIEPELVIPKNKITINCSFDLTYNETNSVFIYNSEYERVYIHIYVNNTGVPGDDYRDTLSNPRDESGWFSIDFKVPYCYKDSMFQCIVFDVNENVGSALYNFKIGVPLQHPYIYIDGSCVSCSEGEIHYRLKKWAPVTVDFQCRVDHVLPKAWMHWQIGDFNTSAIGSGVENPGTCTFNQTYVRDYHLESSVVAVCTVRNLFGEQETKRITVVPYTGVELLLPAIMEGSTTVTLKCTSDVSLGDAWFVKISNGTGHLIYDFYFTPIGGKVGAGFEDMVSNPRRGRYGRWVSIDFRIPVTYTDTAFGCVFVGSGRHGTDRRTFLRKHMFKVTN